MAENNNGGADSVSKPQTTILGSPWALIFLGLIICGIGGAMLGGDDLMVVGWLLLLIGIPLAQVGLIAAGVEYAMIRIEQRGV
jgi:hypothetical protein